MGALRPVELQPSYAPINVKPQGGGATHGELTEHAFPWVGILTFKRCPRIGNLTWPPSWKTERNILLCATDVKIL